MIIKGVLFESHPETSTCFMKDIPQGVVSMDKFAAFLDKKTVSSVSYDTVLLVSFVPRKEWLLRIR